jgi:hypothetical protein
VIRIVFEKILPENSKIAPGKEWIDLAQSVSVAWYIGDTLDKEMFVNYIPSHTHADGKELDYIVRYFCRIPIAYEPWALASSGKLVEVQSWHGETARFIAEHLPRK